VVLNLRPVNTIARLTHTPRVDIAKSKDWGQESVTINLKRDVRYSRGEGVAHGLKLVVKRSVSGIDSDGNLLTPNTTSQARSPPSGKSSVGASAVVTAGVSFRSTFSSLGKVS
jgi:hypothetical protein